MNDYEAVSIRSEIQAWQYLIDTGLAWKLQGWFGRTADHLIEIGLCTKRTYEKLNND